MLFSCLWCRKKPLTMKNIPNIAEIENIIEILIFVCRMLPSSTRPTLSSCICWFVIWSTAKSRASKNCRHLCWRACICLIPTWETRLATHWSHSWWRSQRINFGIGKLSTAKAWKWIVTGFFKRWTKQIKSKKQA